MGPTLKNRRKKQFNSGSRGIEIKKNHSKLKERISKKLKTEKENITKLLVSGVSRTQSNT